MSNIFANPFHSGDQKAISWERIFYDHSVGQGDRAGTVLTLRQYPTGTGFVRTVNCAPGQLTVITGDYETDSKHFREALIGRPSNTPVSIRYGTDDVSASEIFSVGVYDILSNDLTVIKTLERAHVPIEEARALLGHARLSANENIPVRELDESSRRQLSILAGLFSRTRFIFFDRPFHTVPSGAVEPLAGLMLKMAQVSKRIVVVTGVEKTPDIWKSSRDVQFASQETKETKSKTLTLRIQREAEPEAVDSVRSMMQGNRTAAESGEYIFTRPMIINPSGSRQVSGGRMQNESIANPNIPDLAGSSKTNGSENGSHGTLTGAKVRTRSPRDSARRKRLNTGSLTRLSYWETIKLRVIGPELMNLPKQILQIFTGPDHEKGATGLPLSTVGKAPAPGFPTLQPGVIAIILAIVLAAMMYFM